MPIDVKLGVHTKAGKWYLPEDTAAGGPNGPVRRGSNEVNAVRGLESVLWPTGERKFALHRMFFRRDSLTTFPQSIQYVLDTAAEDRIPSCHWRIWNVGTMTSPGTNNKTWATIAAGQDDTLLEGLADQIVAWPGGAAAKPPALTMDFDWEMYAYSQEKFNTDGNCRGGSEPVGTRQEFVAAYRHTVLTIRNRWAATSFPSFPVYFGPGWMREDFFRSSVKYGTWDEWYPGDDVCDYIGGDLYNWSPSRTGPYEQYADFALDAYRRARQHNKKVYIGETAAQEADGYDARLRGVNPDVPDYWPSQADVDPPNPGGSATAKEQWIRNLRDVLLMDRATAPTQVNGEDTWGINWYDSTPGAHTDDADHALDSRPGSTAAFRQMSMLDEFNGGGGGTTPPPAGVLGVFWNTGFEHGAAGVTTNVGDVTVQSTDLRNGNWALRANSTAVQMAYASYAFPQDKTVLSGQVAFYLPALPAGTRRLFSIVGVPNQVIFNITSTGRVGARWNEEATELTATGETVAAAAWHRITFKINCTQGTIVFTVDNYPEHATAAFQGSSTPALLGSESFEGQADEVNVTTTNSNFDNASSLTAGSTIKFDTAQAAHGTKAGRFVLDSSGYVAWNAFTAIEGTIWWRGYIYIAANPADNISFLRFVNDAGTQAVRIILKTTRTIEIRNQSNAVIATSTTVLATGQWYRLEVRVKAHTTNGQVELRIYSTMDAAVGSATEIVQPTPLDTFATGTNIKGVRHGMASTPTAAVTFWLDDVAISQVGFIGPAGGGGGGGDAGVLKSIRLGTDQNEAITTIFDDVVLSSLGADYPLADHYVAGKVPNLIPDTGGTQTSGGTASGIFSGLTQQTPETVAAVQMPQLDAVQDNFPTEALPHFSDSTGLDDPTNPDLEYLRLVQCILEVGDVVYLGGGFHNIGGKVRLHLAAFDQTDPTTGILNSWNPGVNTHKFGSGANMMRLGTGGSVRSMVASPDGNWIYVAGNFTNIGNPGVPRSLVARIGAVGSPNAGIVDAGFVPPTFSGGGASIGSLAISPDGNTLYCGGDFTSVGGNLVNFLVALDAVNGKQVGAGTGARAAAGDFRGTTDLRVESIALSPDGSLLYVAGKLTALTVPGTTRARTLLGAFTTAGQGTVDAWNPTGSGWSAATGTGNAFSVLDIAVSPDGKWLAAGTAGSGAVAANSLVIFKVHGTAGGAVDTYVDSSQSRTDTGNMQAVEISNTHAYGTSHATGQRLHARNLSTLTTETAWSDGVNWNGGVRGGWALHLSSDALNVGGACSSPRQSYARFRALTPSTSGGTDQPIFVRDDDSGPVVSGSWARIDEWPPTGDGIKQALENAGAKVVIDMTDVDDLLGNLNGVTVVAAYRSSAAGVNDAAIRAKDSAQIVDILGGSSAFQWQGGTGTKYVSKGIVRTAGDAWTKPLADDTQIQFGFSNDTTPQPILDAVMLEVALKNPAPPPGGGTVWIGTTVLDFVPVMTAQATAITSNTALLESFFQLTATAQVQIGSTAVRRVQRGLGYVVHQFETEDDNVVIPIMADWQMNEEAPGGLMDASGTIDAQALIDHPLALRFGATYRAILAESGEFLFGGRLLQPSVDRGAAMLSMRGWGSIYGEKTAGRVLVLAYGTDDWEERDNPPGGKPWGNNRNIELSTEKGILKWTTPLDIAGEAGFRFSVGGEASITRVAVDIQKTGDSNDIDLKLDYAQTIGGTLSTAGVSNPTRTLTSSVVDGSTLSWTLDQPAAVVRLSLIVRSAATGPKFTVQLSNVRVNGIGNDDNVGVSTVVQSLFDRVGLQKSVVLANQTVAGPYDENAGNIAESLDFFSMLSDWNWLVTENLGPFAYFQPWNTRVWEVPDSTEVRPVQLDRFTGVRVPFRRNSGARDAMVVKANPNPLPYESIYTEVELEGKAPNSDHAKLLGENLLNVLLPPRWGGNARLAEVRGIDGFRYSAHLVRAGDTLIVPWLTLDEWGGPATFRVSQVSKQADGVDVTFLDRPTGLERIVRRRGNRMRGAQSN